MGEKLIVHLVSQVILALTVAMVVLFAVVRLHDTSLCKVTRSTSSPFSRK